MFDINLITQGITAGVIYALIEGAKRVQAIPINDGQRKTIRAVVGVLAVVSTGLTAYLSGNLTTWLGSDEVNILIQSGVVFAMTWIFHKARNGVVAFRNGR